MTEGKETLREAVARAIAEIEGFDPAMDYIEGWYETADAAIATMFERLRTRLDHAMNAYHNSQDWHSEPAPDESAENLYDWIFADARKENDDD